MRAINPIFVRPRLVERAWGRADRGDWLKGASVPGARVAEAWVMDAANATDAGPLGRRLSHQASAMLGDLGRAPPKLRLVFPGTATEVRSISPLSLWTILEPGAGQFAYADVAHRPGERIRAYEGANLSLAEGSVALEVSCTFLPDNDTDAGPQLIRLPPVSSRTRATLFRDTGLSVETWQLPEWSRVVPDGETCHVLVALGQGIRVDGRELQPGEAVFVPAWGLPFDVATNRKGSKLLAAYPDRTPTAVWQPKPGPDPAAGQLPKPEPAYPALQAAIEIPEASLAA
jgi:hypothetical protein